MLRPIPSSTRAAAITPAEPVGARVARFPTAGSLPRYSGGSASALPVSRPARRSTSLLSSNGCGWVEARSAGRRGVLAARVASELTAHGVHLTGGGRGAPWPGVGRSGVAAGRPACQRATRVLRLSVYHWLEWALGWPIPAAPLASQASQTPLGGRWSDRVLRGPSRVVAQFGRHRLPKSWMDTRASRLA